jgi:hypothetical protein
MPHPRFDRYQLNFKKLADRKNKVSIEKDSVPVTQKPLNINTQGQTIIEKTAEKIRCARKGNRAVMLAFGAHTIKNGMAPTLIALMEKGWLTHLATNGAGIIHDWEFAFQGKTSEDVRENVEKGQFGIWEETGFYINLALIVGAYEGLGYGESVGKMILQEGLKIPKISDLNNIVIENVSSSPDLAAAAADLAGVINKFSLKAGFMQIPHPYKKYSVQACAFRLGIPFTGHPMIGHDIIYSHPINNGAAVGRTAMNDFLSYAKSVSELDHGVYMSVGSAIMSPMIFEKSLSMAQNIKITMHQKIENHYMLIVDLARTTWNWQKDGEPSADNPEYYLRFCKTFQRMGGEMNYLTADNRDFLLALLHKLTEV